MKAIILIGLIVLAGCNLDTIEPHESSFKKGLNASKEGTRIYSVDDWLDEPKYKISEEELNEFCGDDINCRISVNDCLRRKSCTLFKNT